MHIFIFFLVNNATKSDLILQNFDASWVKGVDMGSLKLGQGPEGTQVIKKHFQCIDVLSIITYIH